MADQLNQLGFIPWLSQLIAHSLHGLSWPIVIVLLILFFFYSHYLFASETAHVSAMYVALLGVAVASTPLFSALILGFFGNLLASTTHYSSGPAPILYSSSSHKTLVDNEYRIRIRLLYHLDWLRLIMDEINRYILINKNSSPIPYFLG